MLYKKVHRQFVREFRVGRKFKYKNSSGGGVFGVYEVTRKPYICGRSIKVNEINNYDEGTYDLIVDLDSGKMIYDYITWLD